MPTMHIECICDKIHYLCKCEIKVIKDTREIFLPIIHKKSQQINNLSVEYRYILLCNYNKFINDIGVPFLKIQNEFESLM